MQRLLKPVSLVLLEPIRTRLHFLLRWTLGFSTSFEHPNYLTIGIRRVACSMTAGCGILLFLAFFDISHEYPPSRCLSMAPDVLINSYCVLLEFRWAMGFCHLA
jgi:hypothetical protein